MLLEVGQTYAGRYRIARKLGEGAMGAVYEAEHILIHRRVALKVLLSSVASRHDALHRFEREAQAAGRIGSPHIVEVHDMGDLATPGLAEGASRFIVMELLEGETLADRLKTKGRLSLEEAASIACQMLAGLGAAHAADIVHRDLKPSNVFLVRGRSGGDFVKLLDFGVSKFSAAGDDMAATAPGSALGTPYYMSPEQAKGAERIDARSDLYAVGVILYQCVTGQVPFDAGTFNELIFRIVLEAPPPLESFLPDADPAFVAIVAKAMAREPDERWPSARAMHEALAQWLANKTGRAIAPGVVPWGEDEAFVPATRGSSPPKLASPTEMFDRAPTLVREPPAPRSRLGVAIGIAVTALVLAAFAVWIATRGRADPPARAATSAPSSAAATGSASIAAPSPAPAITASAAPSAASPAARPAPKKAAPTATADAPQGRTVPSDL